MPLIHRRWLVLLNIYVRGQTGFLPPRCTGVASILWVAPHPAQASNSRWRDAIGHLLQKLFGVTIALIALRQKSLLSSFARISAASTGEAGQRKLHEAAPKHLRLPMSCRRRATCVLREHSFSVRRHGWGPSQGGQVSSTQAGRLDHAAKPCLGHGCRQEDLKILRARQLQGALVPGGGHNCGQKSH